jgi:hypothetical protein
VERALITIGVRTSAAAVVSTISQRPFTAATVGRRTKRTPSTLERSRVTIVTTT